MFYSEQWFPFDLESLMIVSHIQYIILCGLAYSFLMKMNNLIPWHYSICLGFGHITNSSVLCILLSTYWFVFLMLHAFRPGTNMWWDILGLVVVYSLSLGAVVDNYVTNAWFHVFFKPVESFWWSLTYLPEL